MVKRLKDMPDVEARHLARIECPTYDDTPPLAGQPLAERRVAIISTAGLHKRGDRPFRPGDGSYRVIPAETPANDLVMSHISVNFDRTGFQQDLNVVFPIDRLRELAAAGSVGSMAAVHYSFMGAFPPAAEPHAQHWPPKADKADAVACPGLTCWYAPARWATERQGIPTTGISLAASTPRPSARRARCG
jgi:D-proline reductase (dithiol) PrdB